MATTNSPLNDKMVLKVLTGEEVNGKPKTKSVTYNYVSNVATDDDFYAVATALQGLSSMGIGSLERVKTSTIAQ